MSTRTRRIAIAGGGVIGLTCAWRLAAAGHEVQLLDPTAGRGASWVAGGMLAPVAEATPGEEDVLTLGGASLQRWPSFAEELAADGGDPGLSTAGTVIAAVDSADVEDLRRLAAYLESVGREVELVPRRKLGVDGLSSSIRSGLIVPGDLAVDNRRLLDALYAACVRRGVTFHSERAVSVADNQIRTDAGVIDADVVLIAAGAWSARLHPELDGRIRPLKGEILRVRAGSRCLPPPKVTVRARVQGRPIYLVPREDGELVVGATQYEAGFDEAVQAGGVRQLLEDAEYVFPAVAEYELSETRTGLRAASMDNLPLVGALTDGVLVASGHSRNGLLMAPITADAVLAMIDDAPVPSAVVPADPSRLKQKEAVS